MVRYQVFISFRGSDTRDNLVEYLYDRLKRLGVVAFLDSKEIDYGRQISTEIVAAIERSDICVPVFSQDFASSPACLMEVAQMVQSKKRILPIFFFVEPSDVRHQLGTYEKSFAEHKRRKRYSESTIKKWEKALTEIAEKGGPIFKKDSLEAPLMAALEAPLKAALGAALGEIHGIDGSESKKAALEAALKAPLEAALVEIGVIKGPEIKNAAPGEIRGTMGRFYEDLFSGFQELEDFISELGKLLKMDEQGMAVCDYNVFLSFRGLDVHPNFLECFHKQLTDAGIAVFIDHKEIEYGERIDDKIGEAIKCSDICIPVLSKNFASSTACLMEVAQMVESGKTILPIFYGVKPSVVRHQQGTYGKSFAEHKKCRDTEAIRKWKTALANITELWGLEWVDVEHGHRELINNVDFKLQQLLRTDRQDLTETLKSPVATIEHVIGIEDQVKKVIKLLQIEDGEGKLHMVGIHGTNGIGKTTIAQAVYNQLSSCFDSCSFLAEIGETAQNDDGIQCVQSKLIRDILERDGDVASLGGIKFFLDVFSNIKALIVLDDVEEQSHLDDLVGNQLEWFGPGSRIIVTSENRGILETCVSRGRADIYEVNKMDNDPALELFRKHASIPWYPEIGKRIVKATGQVPFVIEVIGSLLRGKTIEDWRKMEDLIKPHSREILKDCGEISKICYEALDDLQEQIFWDIAWFANGVDSQIVSYMWPDLDLLPSYQVLMPLAKIGEDNMLQMHKLLKRLCRTIDQKTKLSRQYMHVTDLEGINRKEGMGEVEALCFDLKNLHPNTITETDLKSMPRIRFLKLDHASMTGNLANVFPKLRWLHWQGCSTDFVATEFSLMELYILDLSWSKVTKDWGCWRLIKMEQLKVLNLTGCTDLLISPTFSSFPNLEILILEQCSRLVHLDPSVGGLKKLLRLNLKSCIELNRLPDELGALKALKELLIDETSVRIIPLGSDSKELETLSASNCVSLSLPNGVGELVKLRCLSFRNCHWIRKLPESIGQSPLEELDISRTSIFELPDSFGNLRRLRVLKMDHCFISKFPSFIWHLHSIEEIHASSCRIIEGEIPGDIRNLKNLRILRLRNSAISSLPPEIEHLSKLETLDVLRCNKLHELPALPSSLIIVHLSPKLKEKVSDLLMKKHCFITV